MTKTCVDCGASLSVEETACPFCGSGNFEAAPRETGSVSLSPLPYGSAIDVWEATADRRVFRLQGGRAGFMGGFAVCWLAFVLFMTSTMIFGKQGAEGDWQAGVFVMGLFWIVGLGLLFSAIRQWHLKTTLLLDRSRLIVERNLFQWRSFDETSLDGVSAADLTVAYEQNYKPVFAVRVNGVERKIQFGAALETADKNWLVDEINGFLSRGLLDDRRPTDSALDLRTKSDEQLLASVTRDGAAVVRDVDGVLELSSTWLGMTQGAAFAVAVAGFAFAGFWYAILYVLPKGALESPFPINVAFALFSIPFVLGGLMPIAIALFALFGKIIATIEKEEIRCRYSAGPFGVTRRMEVASIDSIGLGADAAADNPRWKSRPNNPSSTCTLRAGTKTMSLPVTSSTAGGQGLAELIHRRTGARRTNA